MIIDFDKIEEQISPKFKGGEGNYISRSYTDDSCKIMRGKLEKGCSIGLHTHETNCEIIYVISGSGKVIYDGIAKSIQESQCHYCPKGHSHTLINENDEPLIFMGIVVNQ